MNTQSMSRASLWAGRIMSGIATIFLTFDAISHILRPKFVLDALQAMGINQNLALPLGLILLVSLILYVIPRSAFFGALLLTAYLGGAVATNVLFNAPMFNIIFAVVIAIFVWAGLYVTSAHIRALVGSKINAR